MVLWEGGLCGIQAKSYIQQDSGNSKTSYDAHVSPEGEAEVRVWSVLSDERGVYYCGVQLRQLGAPAGCRGSQVEPASQLPLPSPSPADLG